MSVDVTIFGLGSEVEPVDGVNCIVSANAYNMAVALAIAGVYQKAEDDDIVFFDPAATKTRILEFEATPNRRSWVEGALKGLVIYKGDTDERIPAEVPDYRKWRLVEGHLKELLEVCEAAIEHRCPVVCQGGIGRFRVGF